MRTSLDPHALSPELVRVLYVAFQRLVKLLKAHNTGQIRRIVVQRSLEQKRFFGRFSSVEILHIDRGQSFLNLQISTQFVALSPLKPDLLAVIVLPQKVCPDFVIEQIFD